MNTTLATLGDDTPVAGGDFMSLLQPHLAYLRHYAFKLCRHVADGQDLYQDVLLKLYVHRHRLSHIRELRPWAAKVMYYQFVDSRRRRGTDPVHLACDVDADALEDHMAGHAAADSMSPAQFAEREERARLLRQTLSSLSERQCHVLTLHYLEDLSLSDISARLAMPMNTVKSLLSRGAALLRTRYGDPAPVTATLPGRRIYRGPHCQPAGASAPRRRRRSRPVAEQVTAIADRCVPASR